MPTPLIELHDIRKVYGGVDTPQVQVLKGVSLSIHAGEFVAIVGASGSGKSTLMNILGCLDRPTSGRYLFAGEDVASLDTDELAWLRREAFGFVFQGYHLIPSASAQENVEMPAIYAGMPAAERHARAAALLTRCCWPPDSWPGRWCRRLDRPSRASSRLARSRRLSGRRPA